MFDKKKINPKEIDKVMEKKVEINDIIQQDRTNNFIKKTKSTFQSSPTNQKKFKKPNRINFYGDR